MEIPTFSNFNNADTDPNKLLFPIKTNDFFLFLQEKTHSSTYQCPIICPVTLENNFCPHFYIKLQQEFRGRRRRICWGKSPRSHNQNVVIK